MIYSNAAGELYRAVDTVGPPARPTPTEQVMAALRAPGPFHNPELADDMEQALTGP